MSETLPWLWWAVRASGLVALAALWFAMIFGVAISGKGAGGWLHVASAAELHRQWAFVALGATLVHAIASVAAPEGGIPAFAVLVPMLSPTLRGAITMGTLGLWGLVALTATSLSRASLSPWVWRAVHALAFGAWVLSLAHTLFAGTDLVNPVVRAVVLATAAVLVGATAQRVLVTARP